MGGFVFLLVILGIFCLLYAGMITAYAGLSVSYLWIWPCMGLLFFCLAGGIWYMEAKGQPLLASKLRRAVISLMLVALVGIGGIEGLILSSENTQVVPNAEYMIVLGAQVKGTRVSRALRYRLDTAVAYLKENTATKVIVSGGQGTGEDITEAEAMFSYLTDQGVDPSRIIKEERATNTAENIRYSRKYIKGTPKHILIVSNGFHIYRSLAIGKKQGVENMSGLSAPTDRIMCLHYYLREALAILKYKITGNI